MSSSTDTAYDIGDATKKQLIVQWTNANLFSGPPLGSFQAILYENTGGANPTCDIRLQYSQLIGKKGATFGNDASIGVEGPADVKNTTNNTDSNRSMYYSFGSTSAATRRADTVKPLSGITSSDGQAICLKWDGTKYNISLEKYDPVFLTKVTPPPAIPTIIAPKINCPTVGATYSWQPGSYAPPTISNVTSYELKVAKKPNPMPDPVPDDPFATTYLKFSKLINTAPLATSYTALPSQDLEAGETYYIVVIAKNTSASGNIQETWSDIKECTAVNNQPPEIAKTLTPTVTPLDDITMTVGDTISPVPFEISDDLTTIGTLILDTSSSDTVLIPTLSATPTASANPQQLTITPKPSTSGKSLITIIVTDSDGLSATASFNLLIKPKLDAISDITVAANSPINVTPAGTGNNLEYSITGKPTSATFDTTTGKLSWTPTNSNVASSPYNITITVTDKMTGATAAQTFQVNVTATTDYNLTVNATGTGTGTITNSSLGINCTYNATVSGTCGAV
ncbi:MAG: putative Ig domain-containing protein, partial [Thiotrichaceae bacterium]